MRIYLSALSRVRLAVWLSDKAFIPGFDRKRWKRFLHAQEEVLYPSELMLLSMKYTQDEVILEGELQFETRDSLIH